MFDFSPKKWLLMTITTFIGFVITYQKLELPFQNELVYFSCGYKGLNTHNDSLWCQSWRYIVTHWNPHSSCRNYTYTSSYFTTGRSVHALNTSCEGPEFVYIFSICVSFCRSFSPHCLRRLPHPACHPLWGCSLPAPPAGSSQTSSDHHTQPCSRSGLLPPSPTPVHEYEHELHGLLPQVSAPSAPTSCLVRNNYLALFVPSVFLKLLASFFFFFSLALQFPPQQWATLQLHRDRWQQQWQLSLTTPQPPPPPWCLSPAPWLGCRGCPTTPESKTFSASSRDTRSVCLVLKLRRRLKWVCCRILQKLARKLYILFFILQHYRWFCM